MERAPDDNKAFKGLPGARPNGPRRGRYFGCSPEEALSPCEGLQGVQAGMHGAGQSVSWGAAYLPHGHPSRASLCH